MRNCIDEGTLQAWFDGELDANTAANVGAHLHACVECAKAAETAALREIMSRTGMTGRRLPKMTAADLRYIEWLKETGRFHKQAA